MSHEGNRVFMSTDACQFMYIHGLFRDDGSKTPDGFEVPLDPKTGRYVLTWEDFRKLSPKHRCEMVVITFLFIYHMETVIEHPKDE